MCNDLYYWVTVRISQSYWHLEQGNNTGMYMGRDQEEGGVTWDRVVGRCIISSISLTTLLH